MSLTDSTPIIAYCQKAINTHFERELSEKNEALEKAQSLLKLRQKQGLSGDEQLTINQGLALLIHTHETLIKELEELHHRATMWLKEKEVKSE